jgi:nucleotide-binding universal stress UspA family protein
MRNVIVGLDGSEASTAALRWAATTVGQHGRIHAVVGVSPQAEDLVDAIAGDPVPFGDVVERDLVNRWTTPARDMVAELTTTVLRRPMHKALDEAATMDGADAIIIGVHYRPNDTVRRIGRATNQLMQTTLYPLVVVPVDPPPVPLEGGKVVVGIGHGDATRSAVRWAAHLARSHEVSIELLHARGDAPVFQAEGITDLVRHEVLGTDRERWEAGRLDHFAALFQTIAGKDAPAAVSSPPGLAATGLEEASRECSLLVIGRHRSKLDRGHHTAQPLRHLLKHAACPVAVIADRPLDEIAEIDPTD